MATSSDGLNWSQGTRLLEAASVPDVIRTSKGMLWVYWVDFSAFTGPLTEKAGVARSSDGRIWERLGVVQFGDLGGMVPVDPDVVELPDGRLRMYFLDFAGANRGVFAIYSATSTDGLNFTLEPGPRFQGDRIFDPDVVRLRDGRYRMYLNNNGPIISATSDDGLTFNRDPGIRLPQGTVPGSIVLPDGSVRLHTCTRGISVYKGGDGLNFTVEREGVIPGAPGLIVCDPSVTFVPNGFLIVYKVNQQR